MSVLEMSRQLLSSSGNSLDALGRKSIDELTEIKGLGRTKAITLAAAFELGNRRALCGVQKRTQITQTDQMVEVFRSVLNNKDHEEFWVAYLDQSHHLIKNERISEGVTRQPSPTSARSCARRWSARLRTSRWLTTTRRETHRRPGTTKRSRARSKRRRA